MKLEQEHEQSSLVHPQRLAPSTCKENLSFYDAYYYKAIKKRTRTIESLYFDLWISPCSYAFWNSLWTWVTI